MAANNQIFLVGRLTKEPELRKTTTGKSICIFPLAVPHFTNGEEQTDFFNCEAWGKTGEKINQYVKKGQQLVVIGSMHFDKYTARSGEIRISSKVNVYDAVFVASKATSSGNFSKAAEQPTVQIPSYAPSDITPPPPTTPGTSEDAFEEAMQDYADITPEDLPF